MQENTITTRQCKIT